MLKTLARKPNIPPVKARKNLAFCLSRHLARQGVFLLLLSISSCIPQPVFSEPINLKASWYSISSLKREGTFKTSKGVMANGRIFDENAYTSASCDFQLGDVLLVRRGNKTVVVTVTDRTNKRFKGKRIDLSKRAFSEISDLELGLVEVQVELINKRRR